MNKEIPSCKYLGNCNYINPDWPEIGGEGREDFCCYPNHHCEQYQKLEKDSELEKEIKK